MEVDALDAHVPEAPALAACAAGGAEPSPPTSTGAGTPSPLGATAAASSSSSWAAAPVGALAHPVFLAAAGAAPAGAETEVFWGEGAKELAAAARLPGPVADWVRGKLRGEPLDAALATKLFDALSALAVYEDLADEFGEDAEALVEELTAELQVWTRHALAAGSAQRRAA